MQVLNITDSLRTVCRYKKDTMLLRTTAGHRRMAAEGWLIKESLTIIGTKPTPFNHPESLSIFLG